MILSPCCCGVNTGRDSLLPVNAAMDRPHQSEPAIWMACLSAARVPRSLASRRRTLERVCSGRVLSPKLATRAFLGSYRRSLFHALPYHYRCQPAEPLTRPLT